MLNTLLRTLPSHFASLYKSCDKSKDNWCVFPLPPDKSLSDVGVDPQKHIDLAHLQQRWLERKAVDDKDVRDAVMISVSGAVHNYLKCVSNVNIHYKLK